MKIPKLHRAAQLKKQPRLKKNELPRSPCLGKISLDFGRRFRIL
jgi:hypothetical protein